MTSQDTFVVRLRRHRERHRISLDDIASATRVKRELLEALERNDLAEWPRGLYARAWIRAYASAVGLDPIDTVDEFCRLFPQGDRRTHATIQEMAAIVAHSSEYRDEVQPEHDRRRTPQLNVLPKPRPTDVVIRALGRHLRVAAGWVMREAKTLKPQGAERSLR